MSENVPISKRLVLINSASSIITRLINAAILIWVIQHLLKRISPEEYSLLPIAMAVMFLVPVLTVMIRGGLARFVTEAYARDDENRVRQIATTMVPIAALAGLVLIGGGLVFASFVEHLLNIPAAHVGDAKLMLALVFAFLGSRLVLTPLTTGLEARQKFIHMNLIQLGATLVRASLLLVLILGVGPRVLWVIVAQVGAGLFDVTAMTILSMRFVPPLRVSRGYFHLPIAREIVSFGAWLAVGQAGGAIRRNAHPFILNLLANPVALTVFHLGWALDEQIRRLMTTATRPIQPVVTAMHAREQTHRLRSTFVRGTRIILWIALAIATPLILFRHEVLKVYLGDTYTQYNEAGTVILLLLSAYPVVYINSMLNKIAQAKGEMAQYTTRLLVIHLANLALALILVGVFEMGATGSALASFLTIVLLQPVLLWPVILQLTDTPFRQFLRQGFGPGVFPAAAASAAVITAKQWLEFNGLLALALALVGTLVLYGSCCLLVFSTQDRRESGMLLNKVMLPVKRLFIG